MSQRDTTSGTQAFLIRCQCALSHLHTGDQRALGTFAQAISTSSDSWAPQHGLWGRCARPGEDEPGTQDPQSSQAAGPRSAAAPLDPELHGAGPGPRKPLSVGWLRTSLSSLLPAAHEPLDVAGAASRG